MQNLPEKIHAQAVRVFENVHDEEGDLIRRIKITLQLHQLGDQAPYFSATCSAKYKSGGERGGAAHGLILAVWPKCKPVVDVHLSDADGVPMHALANAWYHAGGCEKPGELTKAGYLKNDVMLAFQRHAPQHADSALAFFNSLQLGPTMQVDRYPANMFHLAKHLRINTAQAESIVSDVASGELTKEGFAQMVDAQRPRWKKEAAAALAFIQANTAK